jgi:hypothetical protein
MSCILWSLAWALATSWRINGLYNHNLLRGRKNWISSVQTFSYGMTWDKFQTLVEPQLPYQRWERAKRAFPGSFPSQRPCDSKKRCTHVLSTVPAIYPTLIFTWVKIRNSLHWHHPCVFINLHFYRWLFIVECKYLEQEGFARWMETLDPAIFWGFLHQMAKADN